MYPQIFSDRIMMISGKINNQRTSGWQVNRKKGGDDIRKQHFFVVAIWPNLGEEKKTNKNFEIKSTHINSHYDLHFHPFYFNSPSSSGFIKNSLKSFAYVNLISLLLLILHCYACNIMPSILNRIMHSSFVYLHGSWNALSITKDFVKHLGSQDVS